MWIGTGEGLVCFLSTDELNYMTYQRKDEYRLIRISAL